jgi:hypothetical protein
MNARRDIGWIDRWVLAHNRTNIPQLQSEQNRYGVSTEYLVGFIYVDQEAGMSLDVASYCTVDGDTITLTRGPRDDNSRMMLRYGVFADVMEITTLTEMQRQTLKLPEEPRWLSAYKVEGQDRIDQMRQIELLHPLRAPGFPDDIGFKLLAKGMQDEYVWGRLMAQVQPDLFVVRLLNQPHQDFGGIRQGDYLLIIVKQFPDGIASICVGKGNPRT